VEETITGRVIAAGDACVIDAAHLRESCVSVGLDDRVCDKDWAYDPGF